MKILEPGRAQKGWSTEAKCTGYGNGGGGCGAKLLVEQPDIYCTYRNSREETEMFHTFRCGACGVETDLRSLAPFDPPPKPRPLPSGRD